MNPIAVENPLLSERVAGRILDLARRAKGPGSRLPSERALASALRVSRTTVQKALELLGERGLVARRHGSGTYLSARMPAAGAPGPGRPRVRRVVVLPPESEPDWRAIYYWNEIWRGLANAARRRAVDVELGAWPGGPVPAEWSAPGTAVVLLGLADRVLLGALVAAGRARPVLVDTVVRDIPVTSVVNGSFAGAREAVGRLVALGHRRIGCLHPAGWERLNPDKMDGYRAALRAGGIEPRGEWLAACDEGRESAREAAERLLALPEPPTAIFGFNDNRALGALDALERRGLAAGRDVAVLGYGDTAFRKGACRTLGSVRIPLRELGARALEEALSGEAPREGKVVVLRDRVVLRESTGKASRTGQATNPPGKEHS
jgi:DNA-binding LacI/PurR family transcriptional regulator